MGKKQPTNKELKSICGHLRYEIIMLHHSMFRMALQQITFADKYSYVESYAVHVRNLTEFIRCRPKYPYVRARDYLDGKDFQEWDSFISKYQTTFNVILKKADVQLAHLSYDRIKYAGDKKGWDFKYCEIIDECLLKWASLVPKSKVDDKILKPIKHYNKKAKLRILKKMLSGVYEQL